MPVRRNTIRFNFVHSPELLDELVSRIPNTTSFTQRHGSLLSLVTAKRDQHLMSVLTQFYYPLSVCWLRHVLENSNRVLEDPNIIDYPQSVITPASQPFLAAVTIARV